MKIAFYTYDLFVGREKLMPWRTIIEIAAVFKKHNLEVNILSGENNPGFSRSYNGIPINSVPKPSDKLNEYLSTEKYSLIFWPVVFRDNSNKFLFANFHKGPKIAYFPGGIYSLKRVLQAIRYIGFKNSLPFLLESIIPKYLLINKLKKFNFDGIITFSDLTKKHLVRAGWNENAIINLLPGNNKDNIECDFNIYNQYIKDRKKYYLYMGAPAPIRGIYVLLEAFVNFAKRNNDALLVLLIRLDPGRPLNELIKFIDDFPFKNQIILITDKITHEQIRPFIINSYSVILPFILIPSEVPLTYFEVLSMGIPIITFKNGGTTDYLSNACLISKFGRKSLSCEMHYFWHQNEIRNKMGERAIQIMAAHPTWNEIGEKWLLFLKKFI